MLISILLESMNRGLKNQLTKIFLLFHPVTPGRSTWEPEHEQEMSFGIPEVLLSRGEVLHKEYLVGEIYELIGNKMHQRLEPNLRLFKLDKNRRLYYKGKPLMNRDGELKTTGIIADTLGIRGL